VNTQSWIEIEQDEYSGSLVRALDEGGMAMFLRVLVSLW